MLRVDPIRDLETQPLALDELASSDLSHRTVLEEAGAIRETLKLCRLTQTPVELRGLGVGEHLGRISEMSNEDMTFSSEDGVSTSAAGRHGAIAFHLFNEYYVFPIAIEAVDSKSCQMKMPAHGYRVHQRQLDRCALSSEQQIPVELREATGRRHIAGHLFDLSSRGLGLLVDAKAQKMVERVMEFDRNVVIELKIPNLRATQPVPAKVVRWEPADGRLRLGVACTLPLAQGDEQALEDFLLDQKYPNVVRARTSDDYENVWNLITDAFQTLTPADQSRRGSSIVTWQKASWSPTPINRIYLLQDQEKVVGTISTSRFCRKTWLIHQLAVDRTKAQVLTHQLYGRVLDYLRHTDEARFTVGCWPKESRVFQKYYVEFIENDLRADCHYLEETNILEFDVTQSAKELETDTTRQNLSIEALQSRDETEVMAELQKLYPPLFLEAMDLRNFDLLMGDVEAIYRKVALRRGRKILVARHQGKLVGFAIAEWGSDDQNVFSLFDNFRVFVTTQDPSMLEDIKRGLLREVLLTYRKHGIRTAICWSKDITLASLVSCGKVFHDAYFWVANTVRMKAFLRHLDRLHGRIHAVRDARASRNSSRSRH